MNQYVSARQYRKQANRLLNHIRHAKRYITNDENKKILSDVDYGDGVFYFLLDKKTGLACEFQLRLFDFTLFPQGAVVWERDNPSNTFFLLN